MKNREEYLAAIKEVDDVIAKMQNEISDAQAALKETETAYEDAVTSFNMDQSEALHGEMELLKAGIANRQKQIKILSDPNVKPRKEAKAAYESFLNNQLEEAADKARKFEKKLKKAQEDYLEMLSQISGYNTEYAKALEKVRGLSGASVYHAETEYIKRFNYEIKLIPGSFYEFKGGR